MIFFSETEMLVLQDLVDSSAGLGWGWVAASGKAQGLNQMPGVELWHVN